MIDPHAIVASSAKIAPNVHIGPFSIVGPHVSIDEGTWIGPHVVVTGHTKIGKHNKIFQFASVGEDCQDKKYAGEETYLEIGDHNVIREGVTIHRGTVQDQKLTKIGNHNLFMAYVHVAHDCVIGNHNIFGNTAALAGHVKIADYVGVNGFCGVHQFCQIGSHSFLAHACLVTQDVPPYVMVAGGQEVTVCGINVEGLKRRGFDAEQIQWLKRAYKIVYRQGLRLEEAIVQLDAMVHECEALALFVNFLKNSTRGIVR